MKYADIEYLNVEPNDMYSNLTEKVKIGRAHV